jgi:hypothetical protein
LALEIPSGLRDSRFGVRYFIAPEIAAELHELSPDARVLECIDAELFLERHGGARVWEGNPTELCTVLQGDASECKREARSLFRGPSQLGKMLRRLTKTRPERVSFSRRGTKRLYRVVPDGWRDTSTTSDSGE